MMEVWDPGTGAAARRPTSSHQIEEGSPDPASHDPQLKLEGSPGGLIPASDPTDIPGTPPGKHDTTERTMAEASLTSAGSK